MNENQTAKPQVALTGKASKPFDPLGSLARHWLEVLVFGLIGFLLLAPLAMLASKSYYEAEGLLRIMPVVPSFITETEDFSITAYYHDFARTQVARLKDRSVLEEALKELPDDLRAQFMPGDTAVSLAALSLGGRLDISRIRDTHLVRLYLEGGKREGLAEIINSVMHVYLKKVADEDTGKNQQRIDFLEQEKQRLEGAISSQVKHLSEVVDSTGTSNFNEAFNSLSRRVNELQGAYTSAYARRVEMESDYARARAEVAALKKLSLQPMVDEMVEKDQSLWDTSFWTYKSLQELRANLDGVTQDNPDRRYIDQRMTGMQDYLDKLRSDVAIRAKDIVYAKRDVELEKILIEAQVKFEAAARTEQTLFQEMQEVSNQATAISGQIFTAQQANEDLIHLRALLDRTDDRLHVLTLESRAPGRVLLESLARPPLEAAGSNRNKLVALAFIAVMGGVATLILVYDLLDNRIRSSRDIVSALGFSPTWPISNYLLTGYGKTSFARVTLDDPENVVARALRSLAGRINMEHERHQARVVLFTGVDASGGATEIALNTATASRRLHERVLVVETNHRHPNLADIAKANPGRPGLAELLLGNAVLEEVLYRDKERGLDLLFFGSPPAPQEIDSEQLLTQIKQLASAYDLVMVDAPPLLTSSLTELLAMHCDIGILVIQGDRSLYRNLRLCYELFYHLRVPAMAGVLNWGAPRYLSWLHVRVHAFIGPIRRRLGQRPPPPTPDEWRAAILSQTQESKAGDNGSQTAPEDNRDT